MRKFSYTPYFTFLKNLVLIDSAVNNFAQNVNLSLVIRMHYLAKRLEPLSL